VFDKRQGSWRLSKFLFFPDTGIPWDAASITIILDAKHLKRLQAIAYSSTTSP
jgi:hypothetical protein